MTNEKKIPVLDMFISSFSVSSSLGTSQKLWKHQYYFRIFPNIYFYKKSNWGGAKGLPQDHIVLSTTLRNKKIICFVVWPHWETRNYHSKSYLRVQTRASDFYRVKTKQS